MKPFEHLESDAHSDVGRVRHNNEDSWRNVPLHGVVCVADGMGGAEEGEVASQALVASLGDAFAGFDTETLSLAAKIGMIEKAVNDTAAWICARSEQRGSGGTGTTFVCVVFDAARPGRAVALHAGDSRAYHFRSGLKQVTRDHSLAAMEGLTNEEDLAPMFRGVVTRAVGVRASVDLERTEFDIQEGDIVFLCSDGLTRMVSDADIEALLKENATASARDIAELLVNAANEAGGRDNITVNVTRVGALPEPVAVVGAGAMEDERETSDGDESTDEHDRTPPSTHDTDPPTDRGHPASDEVLVGKTPSAAHDLTGTGETHVGAVEPPLAPPADREKGGPMLKPTAGRVLALLIVIVLAGLVAIPCLRAPKPGECVVRVARTTDGMRVFFRSAGAVEWTEVKGPLSLPTGATEFKWTRPDFDPTEAVIDVHGNELQVPAPATWTPAPALSLLLELEAARSRGDWARLDAFFGSGQSAGLLEQEEHRRRWQALRQAWDARQTPDGGGVESSPRDAMEPEAVQPEQAQHQNHG